jgi:hypothetical protein
MLKQALLVTLFLALPASAFATGINLYWNDCPLGDGARTNQNFACDTNAGASTLVASFEPPFGITKLVAASAVIDIEWNGSTVPSWWRPDAGECRDGSLSVSFLGQASGSCADYWSNATGDLLFVHAPYGDPNNVRIVVTWSIPEAMAGPVLQGNEYYAFQLVFDHSKTTGDSACVGCNVPACIVITEITLYQPPGLGDYRVCYVLNSQFATWQGGAVGGPGCPPVDQPQCITPAVNRTWGQIKGIYR